MDSTNDECKSTISVQDADGARELTDHGERPDWSLDGTRLVFMLVDYEGRSVRRGSIAVMDIDGSHLRRLVKEADHLTRELRLPRGGGGQGQTAGSLPGVTPHSI